MRTPSITIEIEKYREDASRRHWALPSWGHSFGQGILPLFVTFQDHLFPVGTAFTIGRGVTFVVSAAHVVREGFKFEPRLDHLLSGGNLPTSIKLKDAGFAVLYHHPNEAGDIEF